MAQIFDSEAGSSVRSKLNNTGLRRNFFADSSQSPTVNDDSADGFEKGSIWVADSAAWLLVDPTPGAADWRSFLGGGGGGGNLSATGSPTAGTLARWTDPTTLTDIDGLRWNTSLNALVVTSTNPRIFFEDSGSGEDAWKLTANSTEFSLNFEDIGGMGGATFLTMNRAGNDVTSIEFSTGNTIHLIDSLGYRITDNGFSRPRPSVDTKIERIVKSGSFSVADSDLYRGNRLIVMNGLADSATITVPNTITFSETVGATQYLTVVNRTNLRVSFVPGSGVEIISFQNKYALNGRGASATLMFDSDDSFFLFGNLDS